MRIISKFKDYYDSIQAYGSDDITYVRHTEIQLARWRDCPQGHFSTHGAPRLSGSKNLTIGFTYYLIFCGRIYIIYKIANRYYTSVPQFFKAVDERTSVPCINTKAGKKPICSATYKDHQAFVAQQRAKDKAQSKTQSNRSIYRFSERGWNTWINTNQNKLSVPNSFHLYWKAPVVSYQPSPHDTYLAGRSEPVFVTNPCLKEVGFARLVDPYTAFQEINMFLGNNMVDQFNPSIGRTDNEIRDSKGMNEWSFRSPSPGKKKRKQRKKK
jgi:hypothetical protein